MIGWRSHQFSGLCRQVKQDSAGIKYTRSSAPPNPSVSTMAGTLPFGLTDRNFAAVPLPFTRIHGHNLVGQASLFEKQCDFRGISRRV